MPWQPTWQLLVAFNNAWNDDPANITTVASPAGTLGAHNVWTDITADVIGQMDTNRGRQHEVDRFQAGTLSVTLDNRAGRYDPWNTSGPYTPLVLPGCPVRLQGTFSSTTYDVFTGVADVWTTLWPEPSNAQTSLSCVDVLTYFNNQYLVSTLYPRTVLADGACAYWRLNDPVGSTHVADRGPNSLTGNAGAPAGGFTAIAPVFGQPGALPVDTATSAQFPDQTTSDFGTITFNGGGGLASLSTATLEFWLQTTVNPTAGVIIDIRIVFGSNTITVNSYNGVTLFCSNSGAGVAANVGFTSLQDGNWHHVLVSTSGSGVNVYFDGVSQTTSGTTAVAGLLQTYIAAQGGSGSGQDVWLQDVAVYPTALSAGQAATHHTVGVGAGVEASGPRIGRILDWIGWPSGPRNLDTGTSQVQAISSPLTTTTVLTYLQTVEQSEDGALFIDVTGKVRFISRGNIFANTTNAATFGDGGGAEIPFELNPQIATDTLDTYPQAQLQRLGGITQTAGKPGGKTFQASGLLNTTDTEVLNYANWIVGNLSTSQPRIRSMTVHPIVDQTGAATTTILGLELMNLVTVNRHNSVGGGAAFSQQAVLEGMNHHINPTAGGSGDWTVDLQLTPWFGQVWILGTSALGTSTRLAF